MKVILYVMFLLQYLCICDFVSKISLRGLLDACSECSYLKYRGVLCPMCPFSLEHIPPTEQHYLISNTLDPPYRSFHCVAFRSSRTAHIHPSGLFVCVCELAESCMVELGEKDERGQDGILRVFVRKQRPYITKP